MARAMAADDKSSAALKPEVLRLQPTAWVPNNARLPVLLYRGAVDVSGKDPAAAFESLFDANGWPCRMAQRCLCLSSLSHGRARGARLCRRKRAAHARRPERARGDRAGRRRRAAAGGHGALPRGRRAPTSWWSAPIRRVRARISAAQRRRPRCWRGSRNCRFRCPIQLAAQTDRCFRSGTSGERGALRKPCAADGISSFVNRVVRDVRSGLRGKAGRSMRPEDSLAGRQGARSYGS